jgi:hypothetical protein
LDRETKIIRAACGGVAGLVIGFLQAPRLQWKLDGLVDPFALGPGIAIIVAVGVLGALIGWFTAPRVPGN